MSCQNSLRVTRHTKAHKRVKRHTQVWIGSPSRQKWASALKCTARKRVDVKEEWNVRHHRIPVSHKQASHISRVIRTAQRAAGSMVSLTITITVIVDISAFPWTLLPDNTAVVRSYAAATPTLLHVRCEEA